MSSKTVDYVRNGFKDLSEKIVARKDREKQNIDKLYRTFHAHLRTRFTELKQKIAEHEELTFAKLKLFSEQEKANADAKINELSCLYSGVTREQRFCRNRDLKEEYIEQLKDQLKNDQETFTVLDTNLKSYQIQDCRHVHDLLNSCTSLFDFQVLEDDTKTTDKQYCCQDETNTTEEIAQAENESAASGFVRVDSRLDSTSSCLHTSNDGHDTISEHTDDDTNEVDDQDQALFTNLKLAGHFTIADLGDTGSLEALGCFKNGVLVVMDTAGRQQYTFNECYSQIGKHKGREYQQDISFVDGTDIMVSTVVQRNKTCMLKIAKVVASGKSFRTIPTKIEYDCRCKVHCVSAQRLSTSGKILTCILCPKEVRIYTISRDGRRPKNVRNFTICASEGLQSEALNEFRYNIQLSKEADFFYYIKDMEQVVCRDVKDPSIVKWEFSRNGFRPGNLCMHGEHLLVTNNFDNAISVICCQTGLEVQMIDLQDVDRAIVNPYAISVSPVKTEMFLTQYSPDLEYRKKKIVYCIAFRKTEHHIVDNVMH